jgi:hypothetical protein
MGIGSNGPADASAADIEGWGAEQVCFFLVSHQRRATSWPLVLHNLHADALNEALAAASVLDYTPGDTVVPVFVMWI